MAGVVAPVATRAKLYRRTNPGERWWFGLLLVPALFAAYVVWHHGPVLEAELSASSTSALRAAGLTGSTVDVSGRAVTISVPTGEDEAAAAAVVQAVDGVASVKTVHVAKDAAEAAACSSLNSELQGGKAIAFSGDSAKVTGEAAKELGSIAGLLARCPSVGISVAGFTDTSSSDAMKISQARAQAVADSLAKAGIPVERIAAQGFGSASPVATGADAGNTNNRVVLEVK